MTDAYPRAARPNEPLRVLYVAVQNPDYPRNSRLRKYLESSFDGQIDVLPLSPRPGYLRHCFELLKQGTRSARGRYDAVILAELSLVFAPISWLLSRYHGARHIVDFFVGLYETHVEDREAVASGSFRARLYKAIDRYAITHADAVVTDTDHRVKALLGEAKASFALPVGAPTWATSQPPVAHDQTIRLLYYGNYIPLHGVPQFLKSLGRMRDDFPFFLTMVGRGEDRQLAEHLVEQLQFGDRVTFIDPVPETDLADLIAAHHIVVGIFGSSAKARSVIPNKVWQGLACGRVVVTRSGEGISELTDLANAQLALSESGSAEDIAEALARASVVRDFNFGGMDKRLEAYVDRRYASFGAWVSATFGTATP